VRAKAVDQHEFAAELKASGEGGKPVEDVVGRSVLGEIAQHDQIETAGRRVGEQFGLPNVDVFES